MAWLKAHSCSSTSLQKRRNDMKLNMEKPRSYKTLDFESSQYCAFLNYFLLSPFSLPPLFFDLSLLFPKLYCCGNFYIFFFCICPVMCCMNIYKEIPPQKKGEKYFHCRLQFSEINGNCRRTTSISISQFLFINLSKYCKRLDVSRLNTRLMPICYELMLSH